MCGQGRCALVRKRQVVSEYGGTVERGKKEGGDSDSGRTYRLCRCGQSKDSRSATDPTTRWASTGPRRRTPARPLSARGSFVAGRGWW